MNKTITEVKIFLKSSSKIFELSFSDYIESYDRLIYSKEETSYHCYLEWIKKIMKDNYISITDDNAEIVIPMSNVKYIKAVVKDLLKT